MQRSNKLDQLTKPLIPYLLKRALVWKRLFLRSFQSVLGQYGYLPFQPFCERFAVTFNVWHLSCDFWNWVFARDGGVNLTAGSNRWVVLSCVNQLFWWVFPLPISLQKNGSKEPMESSVIFGDRCWWWAPEGSKFAVNSCWWRSRGDNHFRPPCS